MPDREPSRFTWGSGYWPTTAFVYGVPNIILAGMNLWNRGKGLLVSSKGFGSPVANSGGVNPLQNISDTYGGLTGGGSIAQAFGDGIYFYAGVGEAFVAGSSIGSVMGGTITIWNGSVALKAGILPPGAPVIDVDEGSGKDSHNKGEVSIALTAIRSLTGGESTIGPPSNVVSTIRRDIRIIELHGIPDEADRIGIYGTAHGFGDIGPYFHLYDVDLPLTMPYIIKFEHDTLNGWTNGQLGDLAPLDYNVPPLCTHCFAINAVIVAAGCYGGAGLGPSYPGKPEAYPPRFTLFIPGGGKVTAIKGSGIEGAVLVCTGSSVNLVTASQSDISPLNIRPIWPTTGVVSANQLAVVGTEIFAWVGMRGPVRDSLASGGDPGDEATSFAEPVMKFFEANNYDAANTIVCYDPASDSVFYVNGSIGIGYCRYLRQWHTPFTFPTTIVTAVTDIVNGRALFSDAGGDLYTLESGSGTTWSMVSQLQGAEFASFIRTLVGARAMVSASCRLDIFTDLNIISPNGYGTNLVAGPGHGAFHHLNIPDAKSFAVGLSGSDAGGTELWGVDMLDITHPVRL